MEPKWVISLRSFKFREKAIEQENDLKDFFSMTLGYSRELHNEARILKYALKVLQSPKIHKDNWNYFESWLLKILTYDPSTLPGVLKLFLLNIKRIDKVKIKRAVEKLIEKNIGKRNSYEISWGLWMAKSLKIKIKKQLISKIFELEDSISILIALDLANSGLIEGSLSAELKHLSNKVLDENSLYNEFWLLAYEGSLKGWLRPNSNFLEQDDFFRILADKKISFYDPTRQINLSIPTRIKGKHALKNFKKNIPNEDISPFSEKIVEKVFFYRPGV